jgi:uncharacterized protein YndB with AHSA1/START domain
MTTATSTDRIEKRVTLDAPRSRVWRALTDVTQFNTWFGVQLATPFAPGAEVSGRLTIRNYEHVTLAIWIEKMEPERFFSFRWHPYAIEPGVDYADEPTTLVTFTLEDAAGGTRLTIVESGFDAIPESRRVKAFSMNSKGWDGQAENLRRFVAAETQADSPSTEKKMVDIIHRIGIKAPIAKVYSALSTVEGVAGWWTRETTGESRPGGTVNVRFLSPTGDEVGRMEFEMVELIPNTEVRWRFRAGPEEWIGTDVTFTLSQNGDTTVVLFGHRNWREAVEFTAHCSMKWATFLLSLRALVETGKGRPSPDDLKIDNWN